MTDYVRSEEEQVAALRQWWKDNGTSIVVGVVLALGAIFGWKGYQSSQYEQRVAASQEFQQLLDAATGSPMGLSEEARVNIQFLADELIKKDEQSSYAVYARLFKAREAVAKEDLANAESLLQAALQFNKQEALTPILQARLARVLVLMSKSDEAIALLDKADASGSSAYLQELKGDLLKVAGRRSEARAAYQAALEAMQASGTDGRLVQMKLDDLAGA